MTHMTIVIIVAAFIGAAALVVALSQFLGQKSESRLENRLAAFTRRGNRIAENKDQTTTVLAEPIDDRLSLAHQILKRFPNLQRLLEQADVGIPPGRLLAIVTVLAGLGLVIALTFRFHPALIPLLPPALGSMPLLWVLLQRRRM